MFVLPMRVLLLWTLTGVEGFAGWLLSRELPQTQRLCAFRGHPCLMLHLLCH